MSTSDHTGPAGTGAAIPEGQGQPTSPGPNPDDLDDLEAHGDQQRVHRTGAPAGTTAAPTTPGPNPNDLDDDRA